MPTYVYRCRKCKHRFELFHSIADESVKRCPRCRGKAERVPAGGAGILFKGSGFYITDYRSRSYRERAKQDSSGGSGTSSSSPSSGSGSGDSGGGWSSSSSDRGSSRGSGGRPRGGSAGSRGRSDGGGSVMASSLTRSLVETHLAAGAARARATAPGAELELRVDQVVMSPAAASLTLALFEVTGRERI